MVGDSLVQSLAREVLKTECGKPEADERLLMLKGCDGGAWRKGSRESIQQRRYKNAPCLAGGYPLQTLALMAQNIRQSESMCMRSKRLDLTALTTMLVVFTIDTNTTVSTSKLGEESPAREPLVGEPEQGIFTRVVVESSLFCALIVVGTYQGVKLLCEVAPIAVQCAREWRQMKKAEHDMRLERRKRSLEYEKYP